MPSNTNKTKSKKKSPEEKDADAQTEKEISEWDIVKCHYCGKEISMLNAKPLDEGRYFVCRRH